ncbi:MAG: copper-binding protein [Opitutae bacterium]|nr:copper-binding protein [Opitutae bacterium]
MKIRSLASALIALLPLAAFAADAKNCGCDCCKGKETCCCQTEERAEAKPAPQTHPLKGVVVDVVAERSSLVVKHEEIPGVMHAMTMMFRVDAETLARVKKGDAIAGRLGRDEDKKWVLSEVKVVAKE